jgi:hypothetical protein
MPRRGARARARVCPHIDANGKSCPELILPGEECPVHPGRPKNQPWSGHREPWERPQRARLRKEALVRAGNRCERCRAEGVPLQVHHVKPISPHGTIADVLIVCKPCHKEIDPWGGR